MPVDFLSGDRVSRYGRFAAGRLGVDPAERAGYGTRKQSRYEHARETRGTFGYREFGEAERLGREEKLRSLPKLKKAAGRVAKAEEVLLDTVDFGAVEAGTPVVKALRQLPHPVGRRKAAATEADQVLVTGSWRRLVFAGPEVEPGCVEKAAYSFCVLEHLHCALRRRDGHQPAGARRQSALSGRIRR